MALDDPEAVAAFYTQTLREHGGGARAVGWNSLHTHIVNFLQILRVDGLADGVTVLDVGCGDGALERFLRAHGFDVDYTGYDICEPLIAEARRLSPGARFEVRDIDRDPPDARFDFVFASGWFGVRMTDHDAWAAHMIETMYGLCDRACVFNMLSARYVRAHPDHDDPMYYTVDPGAVVSRCLSLTPQVTLDHTEQAQSFTIYMYRGNAAPARRLEAELSPGNELDDGHRAVAEQLAALGLVDEAFVYLERLPPTAALYEHIAMLAFDFGASERQLPAWQCAAELAPESAAIHARLAIAYIDAGRPTEAIAALERAHAIDPNDATITTRLQRYRDAIDT